MVAPPPRRDPMLTAKDASAPPHLCEHSIKGTPHRPPSKRSHSALKRLNQLEKTCYLGVPSGAEPRGEEPEESQRDSDSSDRSMWMGSGYMQKKDVKLIMKPKLGDGTGDGHEERTPIQPWFFNTDSHLLERRRVQSQVQCVSRVLRDHNRAPGRKSRLGRGTPGLESENPTPTPSTTFVEADPRSPAPTLGKGKLGGLQLMVPPRSDSRTSLTASRAGATEETGHVYTRHYGSKQQGGKIAKGNWKNEEFGIFPGSGHTTGSIGSIATKKAREHTSLHTLLRDRATHARSTIPLPEKYNKPMTSAQEVGWDLAQAEWHDNQQFPKMRCYFTAYNQDLKTGGVQDQLVLRRVGMKC